VACRLQAIHHDRPPFIFEARFRPAEGEPTLRAPSANLLKTKENFMERNGKIDMVTDSGPLGSPRVPKLNDMHRIGTKPIIDPQAPGG
jgi:hypothetical protein